MMDLGHGQAVEPLSSSSFRDAIFSRHDLLRGVVAETVELAAPGARAGTDLDTLRASARRLYHTLEEVLAFEDEALPPALRDVIGWGAVLQEQLEHEHSRQRQALAAALSALEPASLSYVELANDVRAFADALLRDIDSEEDALLNGYLDEMAVDSAGG
jgi:hypothetical protein